MDGEIGVAIGRDDPIIHMGVEPAHLCHVAGIYPKGGQCAEVIVEGGLAGLLFPRPREGGVMHLHGQGLAVAEVLNHGVVP